MEPGIVCIDIRREFVLEDALREARKKRFSPKKKLKVRLLFGLKVMMIIIFDRLLLLVKGLSIMAGLVVNFFASWLLRHLDATFREKGANSLQMMSLLFK